MARYSRKLSPAVSLTLAAALWGIATVISKALLASTPPITFLFIQLVPSAVLLWLLVAGRKRTSGAWRGLVPLALLGLLNPGLAYTLSMLGLAETTASVATLLWAAEPALIVVTAWLLLKEAVTFRFLAATAAAAFGVLLVSGVVGGGQVLGASTYGAALILAGVFCCALYTVLTRHIASNIDPLPAVAIQQTVGLAFVVAIWPLEPRGDAIGSLAELSRAEMLGGTVSGLMYYVVAFWFYLNALRSVPATTASIFLNLTPVFGIAAAYAFLGEQLTASQWMGATIILLSILSLLTWAAAPKEQESSPGP